jgi:hypothetical protein
MHTMYSAWSCSHLLRCTMIQQSLDHQANAAWHCDRVYSIETQCSFCITGTLALLTHVSYAFQSS